jgi:hypothetical protein
VRVIVQFCGSLISKHFARGRTKSLPVDHYELLDPCQLYDIDLELAQDELIRFRDEKEVRVDQITHQSCELALYSFQHLLIR